MLLTVIFMLFISNGLPNSLLGSAWTAICPAVGAQASAAGTISMVMMAGPILTNLFIGKILKRISTRQAVLAGTLVSAASLAGFGMARSTAWLYAAAVPLGLGVGLLDAAINLYIAQRYESRHINWSNGMWGIGAMAGPMIIGLWIKAGNWRGGYFTVAAVQVCVAFTVLATYSAWNRGPSAIKPTAAQPERAAPLLQFAKRPSTIVVVLCVMLYFGAELGFGLWAGSYVTLVKGVDAARAAGLVSLFYGAIMAGRLVSGVLVAKISNMNMVRISLCVMMAGLALFLVPGGEGAAFAVYGLGCAPVFPCTLAEMKVRLGVADTAEHLGVILGVSRLGLAVLPEVIGRLSAATGFRGFIPILLAVCAAVIILNETAGRLAAGRAAKEGDGA